MCSFCVFSSLGFCFWFYFAIISSSSSSSSYFLFSFEWINSFSFFVEEIIFHLRGNKGTRRRSIVLIILLILLLNHGKIYYQEKCIIIAGFTHYWKKIISTFLQTFQNFPELSSLTSKYFSQLIFFPTIQIVHFILWYTIIFFMQV